jgi:hypothetical protein
MTIDFCRTLRSIDGMIFTHTFSVHDNSDNALEKITCRSCMRFERLYISAYYTKMSLLKSKYPLAIESCTVHAQMVSYNVVPAVGQSLSI